MKHVRLLIIMCVIVVIAFTTLCVRAIFSVSDVIIDYSYYDQSEIEICNSLLTSYNGKFLPFVNKKKIVKLISDNTGLKVESVEKDFPNKIRIKLKEKQEKFYIKTDSGYIILDQEYTVVDIRDNPKNAVDGLDYILLEFKNSGFSYEFLTLRSTLTIGNDSLFQAFAKIVEGIDRPRDYITKITVEEKELGLNYYVYLETFEGVIIEIRKATDKPELKISQAMKKYLSLDDVDRLSGKVAAYSLDNGEVVAIYTH